VLEGRLQLLLVRLALFEIVVVVAAVAEQAALPDRGLAGFFLADRDARLADARLIFGAGRSSSTSS